MKLSEAETRKKLIDPILERVGWRVGGHYLKEEVNPVKSKFITKEYIQSFSQKCLKGIVNKKSFENIAFICPPLSLQQKFASIVKQVEKMALSDNYRKI